MTGQIMTAAGVPYLVLNDAGRWETPAGTEAEMRPMLEAQAEVFDVLFDPRADEHADHHLPFGAVALMAASRKIGGAYTVTPAAPLPEGAIS